MILLHPSFPLLTSALIIFLLARYRPGFRSIWIFGFLGFLLTLGTTIYWKFHLPTTFSILNAHFSSWPTPSLAWSIDSSNLPLISALVILTLTVLVIKGEKLDYFQISWNFLFIAFGILAISSNNPYTLITTWSALALMEFLFILPHQDSNDNQPTILLGLRLLELFLILWASVLSRDSLELNDFRNFGQNAGFLLIFAAALHLGIFPSVIENSTKRPKGNVPFTFNAVSSAAGFSLLTKLSVGSIPPVWKISLLVSLGMVTVLIGLYALFSIEGMTTRRLRLIGFGSLALATILLKNPQGTAVLGSIYVLLELFLNIFQPVKSIALIVETSLLFIFTAGLPISYTLHVWDNSTELNNLWLVPLLAGYILLQAGIFKKYRNIINNSNGIEISPDQTRKYSLVELSVIPLFLLIFGFSPPPTHISTFQWGIGLSVSFITMLLIILTPKLNPFRPRFLSSKLAFPVEIFSSTFRKLLMILTNLINSLTSVLEGDGGVLWSIVILVLLISLMARNK